MTHRIISAKPLDNMILSVVFQNGIEKAYDVRNLYSIFPQFKDLEMIYGLFQQVIVDAGGYGVSWNDELDLAAETIWEDGVETGYISKTERGLANPSISTLQRLADGLGVRLQIEFIRNTKDI